MLSLLLVVVTMCWIGELIIFICFLFSWQIVLVLWHFPFLLKSDVKLKALNVHA